MTPTLVVEFLAGSRIRRGRPFRSPLPVLRNGPPGTFVDLPCQVRISLPTDQVVLAEDGAGAARVGFGGMCFEGLEADGRLRFRRVRDLWPEAELSPERGDVMLLAAQYVHSVEVDGRQVWPGC